jgi:hypothetical protein
LCTAAIFICHRCEHRQKGCAGPCACTINGKDIIENANARECPKGKFPADLDCGAQPPPAEPPKPVPYDEWPKWAKAVEKFRSGDDVGVGSTIRRQLGILGEGFKASLRLMGVECGCDARHDEWNIVYPYSLKGEGPA